MLNALRKGIIRHSRLRGSAKSPSLIDSRQRCSGLVKVARQTPCINKATGDKLRNEMGHYMNFLGLVCPDTLFACSIWSRINYGVATAPCCNAETGRACRGSVTSRSAINYGPTRYAGWHAGWLFSTVKHDRPALLMLCSLHT